MNRQVCLSVALCVALLSSHGEAQAALVFSEDFNAYTPGNLLGQGGWGLQDSNTNPIQVSAGLAAGPMTTGQDLNKASSSTVPRLAGEALGGSLVTEFDLNVTAAGSGDFFAQLSVSPGNTTFFNRFYIKAGGAANTFQLAVSASAVAGGIVNLNYGDDLPFGQTHRVQSTWEFVPGLVNNDQFSLSVNNLPYVAPFAWDSNTDESINIGAFNLRQGGSNGPTIAFIDNISVTHHVPEPGSLALCVLGLAGAVLLRRR
jgi:hypothetical protein